MKFEGVKGPSGPFQLLSFDAPDSINDCKVMSDADMGGFSTASLDFVPASTSASEPAHARFYGTISTKLPPNKPEVQRSGYAGFRTADRPATIFGKSLWDIDMYTYLALRIRTPPAASSSWLVNVQTESLDPTDLHQHRLYARRPGEWETVLIRWNDFVRTNHGLPVEPQAEMLRRKVRSVGLALTDRVPGPFELCIQRLWATNDPSGTYHDPYNPAAVDGAGASSAKHQGGKLKNKRGESVGWSE